jgi:hypothetical protein
MVGADDIVDCGAGVVGGGDDGGVNNAEVEALKGKRVGEEHGRNTLQKW